jgi:small conductance mechanosensitive channel
MKPKKKVDISQAVRWLILLLVFLAVTNPSLIPFLPRETKQTLKNAWSSVLGDVTQISKAVTINPVTIFKVIAIVLMLFFIKSLLDFIIGKISPKTGKGMSALSLLSSAKSYILVVVGFFWILSAIGVNVSTIFAGVGVVALIVGFGAQSLVEDLVTGLFLVFENEFNVGDIIEVNGFRGWVRAIGIRTTIVEDVGKNRKIINNSDLRNILNRSSSVSTAVATVSVAYDTDLDRLETVLSQSLPAVKKAYPDIFVGDVTYMGVQNLGDSGMELRITAETNERDIYTAQRILNKEIKRILDRYSIEIPFPQLVVQEKK